MAKLSIFFLILCFVPCLFALDPYSYFSRIDLPPGVVAPDSVALDPNNEGPYACVNDGRILKYKGPTVGWIDFAFTSPDRTKEQCDGVRNVNLGPICGRCLGLSFNYLTGPKGGLATLLANSAEGVPFRYLNGVDADPVSGDVYFSDSSTTFDLRDITNCNPTPDSTGRLLKYNVWTKEVKVLMRGISVPIGPAVSIDRTFLLFSELGTKRVIKYWLRGLKQNTTEVLLEVPGNPRKIKKASAPGEFWVPVTIEDSDQPNLPFGYKINSSGKVLLKKELQEQYPNAIISVIQEYYGTLLYIGTRSLDVNYVGKYSTIYSN